MKSLLFFIILSSISAGCNKSGSFESLEEVVVENNESLNDGAIVIQSVSPSTDPFTLQIGLNTFAVQIASGAGKNVSYQFRLDGVVVQESSVPFYSMTGAGQPPGAHTLEVTVSNSRQSASHNFNYYVNTPPVMTLVGTSVATPATISCIGGNFSMNVSAADVDGDPLTFSFYLNGSTGSAGLSNGFTANTATTTFTPNCSMVGNVNIKIRVTDSNGDYDEKTVALSVSNPNQATITHFSPLATPVIIRSTDTTQFIISPDGSPPYTVAWTINPGGVIAACANQTSCILNGGGANVGSYILNVLLTDSNSTSDDKDFSLIFNAAPSFTSASFRTTVNGVVGSPTVASQVNFNCMDAVQFSVTVNDQNFGDAGQSHSINWTYGGVAINDPSISSMFSVERNTATNPMTSTLNFTPGCHAAALNGATEIKVVASDGLETSESSWSVLSSYLSTYCLSLQPGEICTIAGRPGLRTGMHTIDDANKINIRPGRIIQGPALDTYFISDEFHGIVWFYNNSDATTFEFKSCATAACAAGPNQFVTISVGPKRLEALVGLGVPGTGTIGQIATNFYLGRPRGLAWDDAGKTLYISDYTNNFIYKVLFDTASTSTLLGKPQIFAGACTAISSCPTSANPATTDTAYNHKCTSPVDLVLTGDDLYATCYGNRYQDNDFTLKRFNIQTLVGNNLVMHRNNSDVAEGLMDGTARARAIFSMIKHPTQDALILGTISGHCHILVANISGTPTFYGPAVGGEVAPAANTLMRLTRGTTNCGAMNTNRWDTAAGRMRVYGLYPRIRAGVMEGIYIINHANHNLGLLNITNATTIDVGGVSIAPGFFARIWGSTTAGPLRPASNASAAYALNKPFGAYETATHLWVGDSGNSAISTLNTSVANGETADILGVVADGGYDGDTDISPTLTRLNEPTSLFFSAPENRLYISDVSNARIRYINLNAGTLKTELSNGALTTSNDPVNNVLANANPFRTPRDIFYVEGKNTLLYSSSGNNSLVVRAFNKNTSGTSDSLFGVPVNIGRVTTVAGQNSMAATTWDQGSMNGQIATQEPVRLASLWGIVSNSEGTILRIANNQDSCILKVDSDNFITEEIGQCGSTYTGTGPIIDGPIASARFYNPRDMELDPEHADDGNFFIVDGNLDMANVNGLRYVNLGPATVTIRDPIGTIIEIDPGHVATITSGIGNYITGVTAFEGWICYSQGAYAVFYSTTPQNVICFERNGAYPVKTIGRSSSATIKGAIQRNLEQEAIDSASANLAGPSGLAFDSNGNLYIAEIQTNTIRMVKRWW